MLGSDNPCNCRVDISNLNTFKQTQLYIKEVIVHRGPKAFYTALFSQLKSANVYVVHPVFGRMFENHF